WFPKATGYMLDEKWGKRAFWFWITGFFVAFMPLYILGFMGMTRRLSQHIEPQYFPMLAIAAFGAVLILCGIMCQIMQLYVTFRDREALRDVTGDPWDGRILEWATSSPPPFYNFAHLPEGNELDAHWYQKERGETHQSSDYQPFHMPKNTGAGVIISAYALVFGFGLIWYIWWLVAIGVVGMIGTWIKHSFNEDVDYYVTVEEVSAIEDAHKARVAGASTKPATNNDEDEMEVEYAN